jgi:hypothetical protein
MRRQARRHRPRAQRLSGLNDSARALHLNWAALAAGAPTTGSEVAETEGR